MKSRRGVFTSFSVAVGLVLLCLIMCLINIRTGKLLLTVISWSIPCSQGKADGIQCLLFRMCCKSKVRFKKLGWNWSGFILGNSTTRDLQRNGELENSLLFCSCCHFANRMKIDVSVGWEVSRPVSWKCAYISDTWRETEFLLRGQWVVSTVNRYPITSIFQCYLKA